MSPTYELTPELRDRIAPVLGRTPSGVFILIAGDGDGQTTGMLASWVQQASFDPPMISVAINRRRYLNDWLVRFRRVTLSLVGESQGKFLKHFGRGFDPQQPAFTGIETELGENGLPVLSEALGYLEGDVAAQIDAGDHLIYLITVTNAGAGELLETERPMVHIRKNGFNY